MRSSATSAPRTRSGPRNSRPALLGPRLRLEPIAQDPYRWYHAADALMLASDIESMPRSLLEAMAFGLPVVAASAWGVPELVTDGVNGFLFVCHAILGALSHPPPAVHVTPGSVARRLRRGGADSRAP